jgi:Cu-Zn family superoxide dismutase
MASVGPQQPEHGGEHGPERAAHADGLAPAGLVAVVGPAAGSTVRGEVRFIQLEGRVRVEGRISGLTPGLHGFHVHEFGDARAPDGSSAGGHFNPGGHAHALPHDAARHAGDMGNILADAEGVAEFSIEIDTLTLAHGPGAILGRSIIVHADPDDGGQPTGNAGARVGVGVIGIAGPEQAGP